MKYVEVAHTSLDAALQESIIWIFYIVCWSIDKARFDEQEMKKWQRTH